MICEEAPGEKKKGCWEGLWKRKKLAERGDPSDKVTFAQLLLRKGKKGSARGGVWEDWWEGNKKSYQSGVKNYKGLIQLRSDWRHQLLSDRRKAVDCNFQEIKFLPTRRKGRGGGSPRFKAINKKKRKA